MLQKRMVFTTLALLITCLLVSCDGSGMSSQQKTAATNALAALRKLQASAQVGVNYQQYGSLLIEAKAQVNTAVSSLTAGELKNEIQAAMDAYSDAYEGWARFLTGEIIVITQPHGDATGYRLKVKYNIPSTTLGTDPVSKNPMEFLSRKVMLSTIWGGAGKHVDRAASLLENEDCLSCRVSLTRHLTTHSTRAEIACFSSARIEWLIQCFRPG